MARAGITIQVTISVNADLVDRIRKLAGDDHRTVSNWCSIALETAVDKAEAE